MTHTATNTDTSYPSARTAPKTDALAQPRGRKRQTRGGMVSTFLALVVLGVWVLASIFPLYWNVVASFLPVDRIFTSPPPLFPSDPTLTNFTGLADAIPTMWINIGNSLIVATVGAGLNVLLSTIAGFAFARLRFWGKEALFYAIIATMAIPALVGFVPLFLFMGRLGLANSIPAVILPSIAGAFGVFLFRQVMEGLPDDLFEAAAIDGASTFTMYRMIAMPLVTPMIITQFIVLFLASFNDYFWPLVILRTPANYTFSLALATITGPSFATPWGEIMAGALILQIPVLVVFTFLSRYIVPNSLAGAVKG